MPTFLKVKDTRSLKYNSDRFVTISLYFFAKNSIGQTIYICKKSELHLIDSFKANILIDNYILGLEQILIDIVDKIVFVASCKININIDTKQKCQLI